MAAWLGLGLAPAAAAELFEFAADQGARSLDAAMAGQLATYRASRATAELWVVRINAGRIKTADGIDLNLPAAASVALSVDRVEQRAGDDFSWHATTAGGQSEATLVVRGDKVVGTIRSANQLYRLRPLGGGLAALMRVDQSRMPAEHPPGFEAIERRSPDRPLPDAEHTAPTADSGAEYTALVTYTDAARSDAGDIDALIQLAVDETNQGYLNSGVNTRIRLVHKYQTSYTESGDMETDLDRFQYAGDGYLDEVHSRRDQWAADVALLITRAYDYCGMATSIYATAASAFAVVAGECATGYYSFAHEVGHLQGARHNPEADPTSYPFAYGHGYYNQAGGWRTIMSYACPGSCTRVNYWSNPNVYYGGVPMGTVSISHNARVLNETAAYIANFRTSPTGPGWHSWTSLGGSALGQAECTTSGTTVDCFTRTSSNQLGWNRLTLATNSWRGWTSLGGSVSAPPSCFARGSRIDCFVRTTAGNLAQIAYNGSSWSGWSNRGGTITHRAVCLSADGVKLDCFARAGNGSLQWLRYTGSAWQRWTNLGGNLNYWPECVGYAGGINCFIWDTGNRLQYRRLTGSLWGAWTNLAGRVSSGADCVVHGAKLDCFVRTTSNHMALRAYNGSSWAAWQELGGTLSKEPTCLGPAANISCFAIYNQALFQRQRISNGWGPWTNRGGQLLAARPACVASGGGRIDCIVGDTANRLTHNYYN